MYVYIYIYTYVCHYPKYITIFPRRIRLIRSRFHYIHIIYSHCIKLYVQFIYIYIYIYYNHQEYPIMMSCNDFTIFDDYPPVLSSHVAMENPAIVQ